MNTQKLPSLWKQLAKAKRFDVASVELLGWVLSVRWHNNGSMWGMRGLTYPPVKWYPRVSFDFGRLSIVFERYYIG